jgi:hypothetical protein
MSKNFDLKNNTYIALASSTRLCDDIFPIYRIEGTDGESANLHPLVGDSTNIKRLLKAPLGNYALTDLDGTKNPRDIKVIDVVNGEAYKPALEVALWLKAYLERETYLSEFYSDGALYKASLKAQCTYLSVSSPEKFAQSLIAVLKTLHSETSNAYNDAKSALEEVFTLVHDVQNQPYKTTVAFHNTDYSKHPKTDKGYYVESGLPTVMVRDTLEVVSDDKVMYCRVLRIDRKESTVRVKSAKGGEGTLIKTSRWNDTWVLAGNDTAYRVKSIRVVPARDEKSAKAWVETCEYLKSRAESMQEIFKQYSGQVRGESALTTPKSLCVPLWELYSDPNPWEKGKFLIALENGDVDSSTEYWEWKARLLLSEDGYIGARVTEALTQISGALEYLKKLQPKN